MPNDPRNPKKFKGGKSTSITWASAGTESLKSTIAAITDAGNAILFSRTIDGSALSLTLFSGNEKSKEYITEVGDIPALLAWAVEQYS